MLAANTTALLFDLTRTWAAYHVTTALNKTLAAMQARSAPYEIPCVCSEAPNQEVT